MPWVSDRQVHEDAERTVREESGESAPVRAVPRQQARRPRLPEEEGEEKAKCSEVAFTAWMREGGSAGKL